MRAPWVAAGGALLLYLPTLAPGLTWRAGGDDAGDLITAAWQVGIPHPTGYPLYILLARLLLTLPLGEPAWRTNLLSALAAAAAAGLVAWAVRDAARRTRGEDNPAATVVGIFAGVTLAATPLLWSQATITEVYSLLAAFTAALIIAARRAAARLRAGQPSGPALVALAFGSGLALTHHTSIAVVLLALWGYVAWTWLDILVPSAVAPGPFLQQGAGPLVEREPGRVWRPLGAFALGLLPLLMLPLRAGAAAMTDWHHPNTWPGFWALISGADYRYLLFHDPPAAMLARAATLLGMLTVGAFGPTVVLVGTGWWRAWQTDRPWAVCGGLAVAANVAFVGVYAAENTLVYGLATLPILAVLLGEGATAFWRRTGPAVAQRVLVGLLLVCLALGAASWAALRAGDQNATGQEHAGVFLHHMETALPPNTLLVTSADRETFSLWYDGLVAGRRPDLLAVDVRLLDAPWFRDNLRAHEPALGVGLPPGGDFAAFTAHAVTGRPVCALRDDLAGPPGWAWRRQPGDFWCLAP
ncbi:MAG TPA: DUF2723 domain-containing protein [Chloroflexia bacterium]|nr:DUF2723 domain-containing protein [Chloroflexia bacterium]